MLFEIYNPVGERVEWTENPRCILKKDAFQRRLKDGYRIKLNGKTVKSFEKIEEILATEASLK